MASAVRMPTGWPFLAHTIAQLAWAAPLPASFFDTEHATSTTSPFTVMSAANAGIARDTANAAPATREIRLRITSTLLENRAIRPLRDGGNHYTPPLDAGRRLE